MRRRHKIPLIVKYFNRAKYLISDMRHCQSNATAHYSARYILEDLNTAEGYKKLAELTGMPEGVIVSAMKNIFKEL